MKRILIALMFTLTLVLHASGQHYVALTWNQSSTFPNWTATTSFTVGQVICPQAGNAGQYEYFAQQGAGWTGISGSAAPAWPQSYTSGQQPPTTAADGGITDWAMVITGNNAATCPPITSNNIYRGSQHGGPYTKIFSSSTPVTSYNDTTCAGMCYYVATAVNANGESPYSNEVEGTENNSAPLPPTNLIEVTH